MAIIFFMTYKPTGSYDKQAEKYLVVTELSYKYAILSDPFNLSAHFSLAKIYTYYPEGQRNQQLKICLLYDLSEEKLLSSPVSDDDEKRNMQYEELERKLFRNAHRYKKSN